VALLLVLLGIGLLVAEIFVTSFGLLSISGIASLIFGLWLFFDTEMTQGVKVSVSLIVTLASIVAFIIFFVGRLLIKDFKKKPMLGINNIVGQKGVVINWNENSGQIRVHGEIWRANSSDSIEVGDVVYITAESNLELTVQKGYQLY
jgi:membrane-bound serine protease (ClpP class)